MQGLHLTGDLSGCRCDPALLTDSAALEALCSAAVEAAGLAQVKRLFHAFAPSRDARAAGRDPLAPGSGITGVVLLAESHLAVHTWPELASVTLDVYVCNYGGDNSVKAQALFDALCNKFDAAGVQSHLLHRGEPS